MYFTNTREYNLFVSIDSSKISLYFTNTREVIPLTLLQEIVLRYCNGFAQRVAKQRFDKQTSTERPFLCGP
jgi:hypothetical protein